MPCMKSSMVEPPPDRSTAVPPLRRLGAVALDAVLGIVFLLVAGIVALGWLLVTTGGGAREATGVANSIAFAIVMGAPPAWLAYLLSSAWPDIARGATPGQVRREIAVEGSPARRLMRLALHPLATVGWWWLAVASWLATIPGLPLVLVSAGLLTAASGLLSVFLLAFRPQSPLLHDRIAGTRMVNQ